jgi:H+-translocating NAD(P) transhydrogenase subunit alpha
MIDLSKGENMKIAVVKESVADERRVALNPDTVNRLVKQQLEIWLESGAGDRAFFSDEAYSAAGAHVVHDANHLWQTVDVLLKVGTVQDADVDRLRSGQIIIGFLNPLNNPDLIAKMADKGVTAISMEMVPRTTRAQVMDALSSQASISGYKAVLMGAAALPKYLPMLTTAAGTIAPAKVFVIGAGVAGLQAVATARRLGAMVEAFDIRPQVKEEIQSLGAKFVEVPIEEDTVAEGGYAKEVSERTKELTQQTIAKHVHNADLVITTAQIPGRPAPMMINAEMVSQMQPGSVIVDLAAENGGNCAYTEAGKTVVHHNVTIIGAVNLPATAQVHATQLYSKNVSALLQLLIKDGEINLDFTDDIINSVCLTHEGRIRNTRIQDLVHSRQAVS